MTSTFNCPALSWARTGAGLAEKTLESRGNELSAVCLSFACRDRPALSLLTLDPAETIAVARDAAAAASVGEILAFLDDDVIVNPEWLERIRDVYADPAVAAAGGRLDHTVQGEALRGLGDVGRILADGRLTRNFAADPGRIIEVDHLPAVALSFRRSAWEAIGGLSRRFPDDGRYAEAEACLHVRHAGGRLLFVPAAIGSAPAPEIPPYGRSDPRALYRLRRAHMAMLVGVYGPGAGLVRHYAATTVREQRRRVVEAAMLTTPYWGRADGTRRPLRRRLDAPLPLGYAVAEIAGLAAGIVTGRRARAAPDPS